MGCGCNMSGSGYSNAAGGGKGLIPEYTTTKVISDGTPGVVGSRQVKSCERPTDMVITSSRKTAFCNDWMGYPAMAVASSDTDPTDDMFNVAPGTVIQEGTPGVVGSRIVKYDGREPRGMVVTSTRKTPFSMVVVGYPDFMVAPSDGTPATTPKYRTAQSGDMRGLPGMTSKVGGGPMGGKNIGTALGMRTTGGRGTDKPYVRDADMTSARSGDMRGLPGMTSFSGFDGAVATNKILRGRSPIHPGRPRDWYLFDGSVATNDILRGKGGMFRGFEG